MPRRGDNFGAAASFGAPEKQPFGGKPRVDHFDRHGETRGLGTGRPRDLLQNYDASAQWRSWREGMRLANQQLGSLDGQMQPARLLHSNPFSEDGALHSTPVLQVSFPSKDSPEGRWTVTVLPRGQQQAQLPLTAAGQREITAVWRQVENGSWVEKSWRLLRVSGIGPLWNEGSGVEADLVGELLEDSLQADGSYAEDEEVVLRMVVAVDGPGDALFLDGKRQWRREPIRDGRGQVLRRRLIEERIPPQQPLALTAGRTLVQSTTLSCNCPSQLGTVLWDWRARASAIEEDGGRMGLAAVSGPLAPPLSIAGVDTMEYLPLGALQTVGRRFTRVDWQRVPASGCKHCHAVRWALGCPCAEPPDPPTPTSPYWLDGDELMRIEEFAVPLAKPGYADLLAVSGMRDAAWRDLDWMVQTVGAADVVSATPGIVPLPEVAILSAQAALLASGSTRAAETGERRFHSGWFPPRPQLAPYARSGDIWLGRGPQIPEPFVGPSETAGVPFLQRGWGPMRVELLG